MSMTSILRTFTILRRLKWCLHHFSRSFVVNKHYFRLSWQVVSLWKWGIVQINLPVLLEIARFSFFLVAHCWPFKIEKEAWHGSLSQISKQWIEPLPKNYNTPVNCTQNSTQTKNGVEDVTKADVWADVEEPHFIQVLCDKRGQALSKKKKKRRGAIECPPRKDIFMQRVQKKLLIFGNIISCV